MFGFRDTSLCPTDVGVSVAVTLHFSRVGYLGSTGRTLPLQRPTRPIPFGTGSLSAGAALGGPRFLGTARHNASLRGTSNAAHRSSVETPMPTLVVRP
jgi:hypothetical protein